MRLSLLVVLAIGSSSSSTTWGFSVVRFYSSGLSARPGQSGKPLAESLLKRPVAWKTSSLYSSRKGNNNDEDSSSSSSSSSPSVGLLERINQWVPTAKGNSNKAMDSSSALSSSSSLLPNDGSVNRWGKFVDPNQELEDEIKVLAVVGSVLVSLVVAWIVFLTHNNGSVEHALTNALALLQGFLSAMKDALADPQQAVQQMVDTVQDLGPLGPLYYVATYVAFEVLALPVVFVLTSSAGFLFGVVQGTLLALTGAAIAATISFTLGRTVLRGPVERWLEDLPQFRKLDRAIVSQGFQITVLERLSPFFPFALSSYVYGATAIDFPSFLSGTLVGFAPGTFLYVYSGVAGKALLGSLDGNHDATTPWYYYAGGLLVLGGILKLLADVVAGMIAEIEDSVDEP